MDIIEFIGILFGIALIYNGTILYLYFKKEISGFFTKKGDGHGNGKTGNPVANNAVKRELMGAVRQDDTFYDFSGRHSAVNQAISLESVSVPKTPDTGFQPPVSKGASKTKHLGDNSFSIDDIERAMSDLNRAIENKNGTTELETDLFGRISQNGSVKIAVTKDDRPIERELMALENTIVI